MLNPLSAAVAAAVLAVCSPALASVNATAIYAFGDSLSDAGNLYTLSANPVYGIAHQPLAPYSDGRFSNGDVWVQDVSKSLGFGTLTPSLQGGTDYAYGGARSGTTDVHAANLTDLPGQIVQFGAAHPGGAPSTALYTLWIGANDVLDALKLLQSDPTDIAEAETVVTEAAQNAADAASALHALGAEDLLLLNVPNLGLTPAYRGTGLQAAASMLAGLFNTELEIDFGKISGLAVYQVDAYAFLDNIIANPSTPEWDFANVEAPCWTGNDTGGPGSLCGATQAEENTYLFWDDVHPTAAGHEIVADLALRAIGAPVPEVSTWAMMAIAFSGLGALGAHRRRAARAV